MKKIALGDTAIGTMNAGTEIIMKYMKEELNNILSKNIVLTFPTHTPIMHTYQEKSSYIKWITNADLKLISATNILRMNLFEFSPLWNINIFNCSPLKNSVLVGVGKSGFGDSPNFYTKLLYKRILSKTYHHSVRDERTKKILETMGFKAINTGCVTLWGLTKDKCNKINCRKSDSVVFALNCKSKNIELDSLILNLIQTKYKKIYFWPQTIGDLEYLCELPRNSNITILSNNIDSFGELLDKGNIDYVGMRMHGGIYCMHHNVRSIIVSVDYRTMDIQKSFNINAVNRENIELLSNKIDSSFVTNVNIDTNAIKRWKSQFDSFL